VRHVASRADEIECIAQDRQLQEQEVATQDVGAASGDAHRPLHVDQPQVDAKIEMVPHLEVEVGQLAPAPRLGVALRLQAVGDLGIGHVGNLEDERGNLGL
jgi:hypothetical protein